MLTIVLKWIIFGCIRSDFVWHRPKHFHCIFHIFDKANIFQRVTIHDNFELIVAFVCSCCTFFGLSVLFFDSYLIYVEHETNLVLINFGIHHSYKFTEQNFVWFYTFASSFSIQSILDGLTAKQLSLLFFAQRVITQLVKLVNCPHVVNNTSFNWKVSWQFGIKINA